MKNWEYYYPIEKECQINSGQSVMRIDQCNMVDDPAIEVIMESAKNDKGYQEVIRCIREGLGRAELKKMHPDHPCQELLYLWPVIGLSQKETLIMISGHRIFVPIKARKTILENLHLPHMGTGTTQQLGMAKYYWHSMKKDIKKRHDSCSV